MLGHGILCSDIPLNCPTAWKRLIPYLSIAVIFVGSCGPVSWFRHGRHYTINKIYSIFVLNMRFERKQKIAASLSITKQTMEMLILPCTPWPFKRKLQKTRNILIKFIPWSKMEKINHTYFAWGGVIMQEDVSILSIWATNRP